MFPDAQRVVTDERIGGHDYSRESAVRFSYRRVDRLHISLDHDGEMGQVKFELLCDRDQARLFRVIEPMDDLAIVAALSGVRGGAVRVIDEHFRRSRGDYVRVDG